MSGEATSQYQGESPHAPEKREQDMKTMVSRAVKKANTAVELDNVQDSKGAIMAYGDACQLLQQAMIRTSDDENRRRLGSIRTTYQTRIKELQRLDAGNEPSEGPPSRSLSESTTIGDVKGDVKACQPIAPTDPAFPIQGHGTTSTYHIYHKKERHACISPSINPSKERFWGPCIREQKEKRRLKKLQATENKDDSSTTKVSSSQADEHEDAFFLHSPYLAFHGPPQVLYTGNSKQSAPAALIHSFAFWRKYKIQLGPAISQPGVIDPRGVVCWRHNGGDSKALRSNDKLLKGYQVRTWRLWGETGKNYVHRVKANRKAGIGPDPDVIKDNTEDVDTGKKCMDVFEYQCKNAPAQADEVVYLNWTSPFSRDTRRYHFRFSGLGFCWKGTGTVKETRRCGFAVRFNHLKLVVQVPETASEEQEKTLGFREVCLGKYTSSVALQKCGILELYDAAIWCLMAEHIPSALADVEDGNRESTTAEFAIVRRTQLYQVIVATAMCMVIGEKQKRETVRKVIEGLATEGAMGGGGG